MTTLGLRRLEKQLYQIAVLLGFAPDYATIQVDVEKPTPEEIAAGTALIRSTWSPEEEQRRRVRGRRVEFELVGGNSHRAPKNGWE